MAQATSLIGDNVNFYAGQLFVALDAAANDSDKTITVPAGQTWDVHNVHVTLAATADVGNRQLVLIVGDGTNTLGTYNTVAVQAASTTEYYNFAPYYGTATETPAGFFCTPMPVHVLSEGWTIRVYDSAAIAATADDLTVAVTGIAY